MEGDYIARFATESWMYKLKFYVDRQEFVVTITAIVRSRVIM